MRNKKSIVSIILMLCLAMTVMLGSGTEVQAASYKKKIKKTVTIKRGEQCVFMMQTKKKTDKSIKVEIAATKKPKKNQVQAVMPDNQFVLKNGKDTNGYLSGKKLSLKPYYKVGKGLHSIYVSNYGNKSVKVTITVTSKYANLKLKSCKKYQAEG